MLAYPPKDTCGLDAGLVSLLTCPDQRTRSFSPKTESFCMVTQISGVAAVNRDSVSVALYKPSPDLTHQGKPGNSARYIFIKASETASFAWMIDNAAKLPSVLKLSKTQGTAQVGEDGRLVLDFNVSALANYTQGDRIYEKLLFSGRSQNRGTDMRIDPLDGIAISITVKALPSIRTSTFSVVVGEGPGKIMWPQAKRLEITHGTPMQLCVTARDGSNHEVTSELVAWLEVSS